MGRRLRLVVTLLLLAFARGQATASPDDGDPQDVVFKVREAFRAKDTERLQSLAKSESVDSWLIVDGLNSLGEWETAKAYAAATPERQRAALVRYAESQAGRRDDPKPRIALETASPASEPEAIEAALRTLAEAPAVKGTVLEVVHGRLHGILLFRLGRAIAASDALTAAADAAQSLGWDTEELALLNLAAVSAGHGGAYTTARERDVRILPLSERLGDSAQRCRTLYELGSIAARIGDFAGAEQRYEECRGCAQASQQTDLAWDAVAAIAGVRSAAGDVAEALRLLSEAETALSAKGAGSRVLDDVRVRLGKLYYDIGDFDVSLTYSRLARSGAQARGKQGFSEAGQAAANIALAFHEKGRYEESQTSMGEAFELLKKAGDDDLILQWLLNRAQMCTDRGQHDAARDAYEETLEFAKRFASAKVLVNAMEGQARSLRLLEKASDAVRVYEEARVEAQRLGMSEELVAIESGLCAAQFAAGHHADALRTATDLALRATQPDRGLDVDGDRIARWRSDAFDAGFEAAVEKGDLDAAQRFLEADRAQRLLESMGGRRTLSPLAVSPTLLARESAAVAKAREESARLREAPPTDSQQEVAARAARRRAADLELQAAVEAVNTEASRAAIAGLLAPRRVKIAELRPLLLPREAFVYYATRGETARALVIQRDKPARIVDLGAAKPLRTAAEALGAGPGPESKASLATLEKALVKSLGLEPASTHLTICPDEATAYLPFGALVGGRTWSFVPSASVYELLAAQRARRGSGAIALGRPQYDRLDKAVALAISRGASDTLADLPATEPEARLAANGAAGSLLLGKNATRVGLEKALANVTASSSRLAVLHLGCHGVVDFARASRCALAFTPTDDDDGYWTTVDILRSSVPADLVVLSACRSGAGPYRAGEGLAGLVRAFLKAGAPRVIASLYKVDDKAALAYMTNFYRRLHAGDAPEKAMAAAYAATPESERLPGAATWVYWGVPGD